MRNEAVSPSTQFFLSEKELLGTLRPPWYSWDYFQGSLSKSNLFLSAVDKIDLKIHEFSIDDGIDREMLGGNE